MDFSSFDFSDTGDLFKTHFHQQLNNDHADDQAHADMFSFMDTTGDFHSAHPTQLSHSQQELSYNIPQLTPDGHESSAYTGSGLLAGQNPGYAMSPLQISAVNNGNTTHLDIYHTPHQHPMGNNNVSESISEYPDEEEFFTPLVSPAIPPSSFQSHTTITTSESGFSPLTSPALHPSHRSLSFGDHRLDRPSANEQPSATMLQQKLALIERQQQQLRTQLQGTQPPSMANHGAVGATGGGGYVSPLLSFTQSSPHLHPAANTSRKPSLRQKVAYSASQTHASIQNAGFQSPQMNNTSDFYPTATATTTTTTTGRALPKSDLLAPATPSLLMKLGSGGVTGNLGSASASTPDKGGSSSAVDNMPSLPAAMIQDQPSSTKSKTSSSPIKRRRISAPKSANFTSPGLRPSPRPHMLNDHTIAALVSPAALGPQPAVASPRALKPLISPSLQPNGKRLSSIEEEEAAALLASKSNYQNLREGKAKSLGIDFNTNIQSGIENRRSAHKAAEQKRRDTLKQSFDSLRKEVLEAMLEDAAAKDDGESASQKEKAVKQMSKVVLLQHSFEYILRLKNDNRRKDGKIQKMRKEMQSLRSQLGLPEVTEEEKEEEAREEEEEKELREARLKRLEDATTEET
ncbi:uncharacterized protein BYT42DRAFT_577747 [Radiomyces spectabilis]|uniref:uncharacterized protein n=1 Tax=Radiomyces spectabilis TaxID=64574 RepID=UPI00221F14B5|nr:uncharacterized protein BYT42DRAFT_577747 [Radiomyces spectabilis]KAI8372717.1 hypothetical protein BYT42DRAFT_577747 [Radiomyces spectabilis]